MSGAFKRGVNPLGYVVSPFDYFGITKVGYACTMEARRKSSGKR